MVNLDILSDPICPWCYIGKTSLDRALNEIGDQPFAIEWHPFQLNPEMPREGMDRRAYLAAKFGGRDGATKAYAPVVARAKELGLAIDFDGMTRTPNTIDAHRLIHWAGLEGHQGLVVQRLFEAYFRDARDIGDAEVLSDIADAAGMDAAVVSRLLSSDADRDDIAARDAHSRQMGISAVPTFIVAQKHAVPGAQTTETWTRITHEILEQLAAPATE